MVAPLTASRPCGFEIALLDVRTARERGVALFVAHGSKALEAAPRVGRGRTHILARARMVADRAGVAKMCRVKTCAVILCRAALAGAFRSRGRVRDVGLSLDAFALASV